MMNLEWSYEWTILQYQYTAKNVNTVMGIPDP